MDIGVNTSKYNIQVMLYAGILTPLVVDMAVVLSAFSIFLLPLGVVLLILIWRRFAERTAFPLDFTKKYLPFVIVATYYLLVYAVCLALGGYNYSGHFINNAMLLTFPFFIPNFIFSFSGDYTLFPYMILLTYSVVICTVSITSKRLKKQSQKGKNSYYLNWVLCWITSASHLSKLQKEVHFFRSGLPCEQNI